MARLSDKKWKKYEEMLFFNSSFIIKHNLIKLSIQISDLVQPGFKAWIVALNIYSIFVFLAW